MMIKDYLSIFNAPISSVLPGSALTVTQSWLAQATTGAGDGKPDSPLVGGLLSCVGLTVRPVKLASALLEATLETYFRDKEDDTEEERVKPSWVALKSQIRWPSGVQIKELLNECVGGGCVLTLYAYIDRKQGECVSYQEEQALGCSVLEYLRILQAVGPARRSGLEPKLPLLYRKLVVILQRQVVHAGASQLGWVVSCLGQLSDVLLSIADASPGWGRNILGAIGLGSNSVTSMRGKFLARSLAIFIRSLLNSEKTALIEKTIDLSEDGCLKAATLNHPEVKCQLEKLRAYKSNKGFNGFHDLLAWVLQQVEVEENTLQEASLFIDYLVIDKLYTEAFLRN